MTTCKVCKQTIKLLNGQWVMPNRIDYPQYCWVNLGNGDSRKHEPEPDTVGVPAKVYSHLETLLSRRASLEQQLRDVEHEIKAYMKENL